jgi:hypothetical protein
LESQTWALCKYYTTGTFFSGLLIGSLFSKNHVCAKFSMFFSLLSSLFLLWFFLVFAGFLFLFSLDFVGHLLLFLCFDDLPRVMGEAVLSLLGS